MSSPTIRVIIPGHGYRADTDTDPDHFALLSDEDWVLIKEKSRGSISVGASSSEPISHNLGYVPLVFVFGQLFGEAWSLILGDSSNLSAYIDVTTTQLIIHNSYASAKNFKYYIFYDQMVASGLLTKSMRYLVSGEDSGIHPVIAVGRSGVDAEQDLDPNHFIYHSDYNTFKIITSGQVDFTIPKNTTLVDYTVLHGKEYRPIVVAFMREGTIDTVVPAGNISGDAGSYLFLVAVSADYTKIIFRITNYSTTTDIVAHLRYFIFEVPL